MKKQLLIGAMLMGAFFTTNAQTIVWSDNFDDEDITDWTVIDADGDGFNWGDMFIVTDDMGQPATPVSLISRSWQTDPLTPDNWAISPAIDLTSYADGSNIELSWKVQAAAAEWDEENYTVYAATANTTEGLEASDITFTEVYPGAGSGEQFDRSLDLSSFAGETVYIAFRHHDVTNMDFLSIDDVTVTSSPPAGINDVLASKFSVFPNPANDVINITNGENILVSGVSIVDINGRTVKTAQFAGVDNASVNVSDLASGVYMMTVSSNKGTMTQKIVKN